MYIIIGCVGLETGEGQQNAHPCLSLALTMMVLEARSMIQS